MRKIRTYGLCAGKGKREPQAKAPATAPFLDSTAMTAEAIGNHFGGSPKRASFALREPLNGPPDLEGCAATARCFISATPPTLN